MAARSVNPPDGRVSGVRRITRPTARPAAEHVLKHRLIVVAPTMIEVVRFAGGWLFDWVMAGWEALVLTTDHTNSRPLRILGAWPIDLECALTSPSRDPWPQAIAVDANLCESDVRVRRVVQDALDRGVAEVRLWGDRCPEDLDGQIGPVQHQLSVAARAFKAQALAAAAGPVDPIGGTETFRRREAPRNPMVLDVLPSA